MLAAAPARHPVAEGGAPWSRARIGRMLAQPKYTGYQVFNRRAARTGRGRSNPIIDRMWSREQAHPVIVPLPEWHETQLATARLRARQMPGWDRVTTGSRSGSPRCARATRKADRPRPCDRDPRPVPHP